MLKWCRNNEAVWCIYGKENWVLWINIGDVETGSTYNTGCMQDRDAIPAATPMFSMMSRRVEDWLTSKYGRVSVRVGKKQRKNGNIFQESCNSCPILVFLFFSFFFLQPKDLLLIPGRYAWNLARRCVLAYSLGARSAILKKSKNQVTTSKKHRKMGQKQTYVPTFLHIVTKRLKIFE